MSERVHQDSGHHFWQGAEPWSLEGRRASEGRSTSRARGASSDGADRRLAVLTRAIETEVFPRMVRAHRLADAAAAVPLVVASPALVLAPAAAEIDAFTTLVLAADESGSHGFIDDLRRRGLSLERVYLEVLAPAARHLGELWEDDRCVFSDVSIALLRLHHMVHGFGPAFQSEIAGEANVAAHAARVLLVPLPGEQHSFGLTVVAAFFRRAGWAVSSGAIDSLDTLRRMVRQEHFALIGFSTGCQTQLETMASSIRMVRRLSRNHDIAVMVGGPLFREHPELAAAVGADGTAADGRQATLCAEQLLAARTITR